MRVPRRILALGLVAALTVATAACDDDDDELTGPSTAPASHTISKDGVRHLEGLNEPEANCTACHGADLRGGPGAPSCFTCHGQEWP